MHKYTLLISLIALASLIACSESSSPSNITPEPLDVAADGHTQSPRLSGGNSDLVLSWLAPGANGTTLRFSRYIEGHWSPAGTVIENVNMFANWADLPSVVPLGENRLAAHWLVQQPHNVYSYDIAVAQSEDGGQSWSTVLAPHSDGTPTEHGFVSMFPHKGKVGLIWLDGRKMAREHDPEDPAATGMTLRAAFADGGETLQGEQVIDDFVCDCCQTDVALASSGPVAVYRNRTAKEIRDISVARFVDGSWQPGRTIAADEWTIAACPVNGPSIVADGKFVAVAWFTAADGPVVRVSTSTNNGETFSGPTNVIDGDTLGRVGLALLDDGDLAVSWLRTDGSGSAEVLVRRVDRDGSLAPIVTVATDAAGFSVPQMVRVDDTLVFAWTVTEDGDHRVSSARVPIDML